MVEESQKNVIRDEMGRKIKTEHLTAGGALDYTNTYRYEGNSAVPYEGQQTYFDTHGNIVRIMTSEVAEDKMHFVTTKDRWYDKDGNLNLALDYDPKTQNKIKEKRFFTDENGFRRYHRKHFDAKTGKETLNQEMVRLGIGDIAVTPKVQAMLEKYTQHYTVPTPKESSLSQQKQAPAANLVSRAALAAKMNR